MLAGVQRMVHKVWIHPANEGRRARQLADATRFQIAARVTGKPVKIRVGERSRLWASLDNGPSILAAYAPQPDYAEWNVWRRHLARATPSWTWARTWASTASWRTNAAPW